MKRFLSMLMAVVIIFGMIPANVFAENIQQSEQSTNEQGQATVNNENVTVTGTNDFGDLLSKDIQKEQDAKNEAFQTGYDVVSLAVENNTATVEFFAKGEASIVVAIYSEDRTQLLSSGTADITADDTVVTVSLPDALPEYFHASAYMVSKEDQRPLCSALHSTLYTQDMQELLDSTIYDYNEDLVLNLDEQTDTNFAVYNEDTVIVEEQTGVNTVVSIDHDTLTYIIDNPSQEVRSLMYGDVLSLPYGDENILFIKIDRVSVSGNRATITGLPIEMQDVFSHVKIDGASNAENAEVDTTTADEGVTFEGITEDRPTRAVEGGSSFTRTISYKFFKDVKAGPEGKYGELTCQLNGAFNLKISLDVKYYITLLHQEFKFSINAIGEFKIGVEGTAKLNIPLGRIAIPVFAGINVGLEPALVFEVNGKAELTISVTSKAGFAFVSGEGIKNISEPLKANASVEAEITIFAGFDLAPQVSVISPSVAKVTLSVPIGVEATAKMTGSAVEGPEALTKNNHTCTFCIEIALDIKFGISIKMTLLDCSWLTWNFKIIELKWRILDGYYSIDHNEFGWTTCPHRAYPLTVTVLNSNNTPMAGVTIQCSPEDCTLTTDAEGKASVYLPNGEYTLNATKGDYAGSAKAKVDGKSSATLKVILSGNVSGNVNWSLTEDGALTISGSGAIPSYTDSTQVPWSNYISMVKSVSISSGVTGIGACVFQNYENLKDVHIGDSVQNIDLDTFQGSDLEKISVSVSNTAYCVDSKGVLYSKDKTILYKAFLPIVGNYEVPSSVAVVGTRAFAGYDDISLLHFTGDAPNIAADALVGVRTEGLYCIRREGWTQEKLQNYGGTVTWNSYDSFLGSGTCGEQLTWILYDDGVLRITGNGAMYDYTSSSEVPWHSLRAQIKEVIFVKGTTNISNYAFHNCINLTDITISDTVTAIGRSAFYNCTSLTEITLPAGLISIGEWAFQDCTGLTHITIPNKVTSVGSGAFSGCAQLKIVTLPDSLTVLENYVFYQCLSLKSVVLPQKVKSIGEWCFYDCTGLNQVTFSKSLETIGSYAFQNCMNLTQLSLPGTLTQISAYAFNCCSGLVAVKIGASQSAVSIDSKAFGYCTALRDLRIEKRVSQIGNSAFYQCSSLLTAPLTGTVSIGESAFEGCTALTNISIPDTVTEMGKKAFAGCSGLTDIQMGSGLTQISAEAFSDCDALTEITVGSSVTTLQASAFGDCSNLKKVTLSATVTTVYNSFVNCPITDVYFQGTADQWCNISLSAPLLRSGNLYCNGSLLTSVTIPDGMTEVKNYLFYGCTSLQTVVVPDSVKTVGKYAFYECANLTNITLGSGITEIQEYAFYNCEKCDIAIPQGVAVIGKRAFLGCAAITNVNIQASGLSIGEAAFSGCTALTDFQFSGSLTELGAYAFYQCSGLTKLSLSGTIKQIKEYTFYGCSNLKSIFIPDSVTEIKYAAFEKCSSLEFFTVPDNVTTIGADAFRYCTALKNITLPSGVTALGTAAFSGCTSLTYADMDTAMTAINAETFSGCTKLYSVTLPDGLQIIGANAFKNTRISSIELPKKVNSIGAGAFESTNLQEITIPDQVTYISNNTFANCTSLQTVTFGASVSSCASRAFEGCSGIRSIYVASVAQWLNICSTGIHHSNDDAKHLYVNGNLVSTLTIPSGVSSIPNYAFRNFTHISQVTIPSGVSAIGYGAFYKCSGITSVSIGNSVSSIGSEAFAYCTSLQQVSLPNSVSSLGNGAFRGCSSMSKITLSTQIRTIPELLFANCSNLSQVSIPSGVSSISNDAFSSCTSLSSITIPSSVTSIGRQAFAFCTGLSKITFQGNAPSIGSNVFYSVSATAYYASGNGTWTEDVLQNYGGSIKWTASSSVKSVTAVNPAMAKATPTLVRGENTRVKRRTITFTDLDAGAEYIFLALVSENEENLLSYENLLYIDQLVADSNGTITVTYIPRITSDTVYEMVSGGAAKNLSTATVTWPEYEENGAQQFFAPTVTYNGQTLTEGVDYVLEGDTCFSVGGNYTCYVEGIGQYIGSYVCAYRVAGTVRVTVPTIIADGTAQQVKPVVAMGGTVLTEGVDYTLSGDLTVTNPGTYAITVTGLGDWAGTKTVEFTVASQGLSYTQIDGGYEVAVGSCTDTQIVIPAEYNGQPVISIKNDAFRSRSSLTSITIPDSVTSIGNYAFYYCSGLTSITIPDSITSIGDSAFYGCSKLTSITIPDSVTSIGNSAFYGCSKLTSITILEGVTNIGDYAFYGCSKLTNITIPNNVTCIGDQAFRYCSQLTIVTLGNGITSIGNYAFYGCDSLTSITIPDSVTSIGNSAFSGCSKLTSITIPDSVTSIGDHAFFGCSSLSKGIQVSAENPAYYSDTNGILFDKKQTKLIQAPTSLSGDYSIPNGVTQICDHAFIHCSNLTSIAIPDSVNYIGDSAFYDCYNLTSASLGNGIISIGYSAFNECPKLSYTIYESGKYLGNSQNPYLVIVDTETTDITSCKIHPDTQVICSSAFYFCSGLTGITIPDKVISIGENAFCGCDGLTDLIIPNNVTSIGDGAFSSCTNLTNITIPNNVTHIGDGAFRYCSQLTSVTLGSGITSIGIRLFSDCTGLNTINIPDSVSSIGESAFSGCSKLTSITIPDSVTSIGDSAFSGCSKLTSITIPDGVTGIGAYTFYNCSGLTSITIPDSVTSIGDYAFYNCNIQTLYIADGSQTVTQAMIVSKNTLTEIIIPDSVTTVERYAFNNCSKLQYNLYNGCKYLGNSQNPYVVLVDTESTNITSCEIHPKTKVIYYSAFSQCSKLTSITIPDSVTSIGDNAFYNCSSLTSITIPDSVTSIGKNAFYNCSKLNGSIVIPEGVTSIGNSAFYLCSDLTSITIPDSVTSIGDSAFRSCSSLTSITIPDSVTSIGDYAFYKCSKLTGSIIIPEGVTSIGAYTFYNCSSLTNITIPDSVTSIGEAAFSGCSSLTSIIIPDSVTSIGGSAFYNCSKLTGSIIIPEGVTSIGAYTFYNCSSLTNIIIPDSVTSIGNNAFSGCAGLTSVTIPNSVISIGKYAFYACSNLTGIWVNSENTSYSSDTYGVLFNKDKTELIQAPSELTGYYTIPDGVNRIEASAFRYCSELTSITIPDSVISIGNFAFEYCSGLTSVTIPDSVTSMGEAVFYDCNSLNSAKIGDGVTGIADNTFYDCDNLSSVTIGNGVTSIGNNAFYYCTSLTSITIPDSVIRIGYNAFYHCSSLTSITIPDSVTSIGDYAFYNCSKLTGSIIIPEGVTSIGKYAFYYCSGLTSITIQEGVTSIGDSAFRSCSSLTSITIPDSVTSIGNSAFYYCSGLTSITIPEGVTSIGDSAFRSCSTLTSIIIPDSVTSIGNSAFRYCSKLNEIRFEGDAPAIGSYAFGSVKATAYYPAGNETWTNAVQQNYGGPITWVPYTKMEVGKWNLTVGDNIGANFYITVNAADVASTVVEITVDDVTVRCPVADAVQTENADEYRFSAQIAAAQMTRPISVSIITDGQTVFQKTYTIRGYADYILDAENGYDAQTQALVREMLHYGAMTQVYFDYNTEDLADRDITNVANTAIPDDAEDMSISGNLDGVAFYGASLVYRDRIAVRYYFTGDVSGLIFTANGDTHTPVEKDGMYYIEIADILPQNLDQQITLTVTDADGSALAVTYGPMNYIVRMNQKGSEVLQNLVKALYNYHLAAKALTA